MFTVERGDNHLSVILKHESGEYVEIRYAGEWGVWLDKPFSHGLDSFKHADDAIEYAKAYLAPKSNDPYPELKRELDRALEYAFSPKRFVVHEFDRDSGKSLEAFLNDLPPDHDLRFMLQPTDRTVQVVVERRDAE